MKSSVIYSGSLLLPCVIEGEEGGGIQARHSSNINFVVPLSFRSEQRHASSLPSNHHLSDNFATS